MVIPAFTVMIPGLIAEAGIQNPSADRAAGIQQMERFLASLLAERLSSGFAGAGKWGVELVHVHCSEAGRRNFEAGEMGCVGAGRLRHLRRRGKNP